jgi:hypothetical protein
VARVDPTRRVRLGCPGDDVALALHVRLLRAHSYGALNLYSDSIDPFGPNEYAIAQAVAAQISVALAAQGEIRGRGVAMSSRTVIGQAEGILMERLGIDADQAFAYLRRISQTENRKLIMICSEIVNTRRLPQ